MELIWSYWHEEGMLVQTLNAILARFQNRRLRDGADPLARFELDPLRPLNNLFWGWAQDELHRLTVRRRAFEYEHEYGLAPARPGGARSGAPWTAGRTSSSRSTPCSTCCHLFFKEDDDTTVIADGFPVLNALRETHLILAEGAHNQFGDLPSDGPGRDADHAVAPGPAGDARVPRRPGDGALRGGLDGPGRLDEADPGLDRRHVTHFRDLGVFGEQLLLSIRYGNWSVVNDPQQAANWARYWRPEIQRYMHAYRAATGVDLTERADGRMPAHLLNGRLRCAVAGSSAEPPWRTSPRRCTSACGTPAASCPAGPPSPAGGRAVLGRPARAVAAADGSRICRVRRARRWPDPRCTRCRTASRCSPRTAPRWPWTRRCTRWPGGRRNGRRGVAREWCRSPTRIWTT